MFSHGKQLDYSWINFDKKDWQNLKIIGKRDAKKAIDSSISEVVQKGFIETSWENDFRNFAYSLVNFAAEVFVNEEIAVEIAGLYKRGVINGEKISEQEIGRILFPKILQHLNKISARKPKTTISDYHGTEVSLVAKYRRLESLGEKFDKQSEEFRESVKNNTDKEKTFNNLLATGKELASVLQSFTVAESKVVKEKLKKVIYKVVSKQSEFRKNPQLKTLLKSFLEAIDAVWGDELVCEIVNSFGQIANKFLHTVTLQKFENFNSLGDGDEEKEKEFQIVIQQLKNLGIETTLKKIMVKATNHFNSLAGEGAQTKNISFDEEQVLNQKIISAPATTPAPRPTGGSKPQGILANIPSFNSIINEIEDPNDNDGNGNQKPSGGKSIGEEIFNELNKSLANVESKTPWYQDPWVWGLSALGLGAAILVYYFFFRKKNNK